MSSGISIWKSVRERSGRIESRGLGWTGGVRAPTTCLDCEIEG